MYIHLYMYIYLSSDPGLSSWTDHSSIDYPFRHVESDSICFFPLSNIYLIKFTIELNWIYERCLSHLYTMDTHLHIPAYIHTHTYTHKYIHIHIYIHTWLIGSFCIRLSLASAVRHLHTEFPDTWGSRGILHMVGGEWTQARWHTLTRSTEGDGSAWSQL